MNERGNQGLTEIDRDIVETFERNFGQLRQVPIALYGVGQKTRLILEYAQGFQIAGVMDRNETGHTIYGKKVLSIEEAGKMAQAVILICNYSCAGLIYERIRHMKQLYGTKIYHLNGTDMISTVGNYTMELVGEEPDWKKLKREIDRHSIISFDLYDTLITRICIKPEDVFEIVETRWNAVSDKKLPFASMRKEAGFEAFQKYGNTANMCQIYAYMEKRAQLNKKIIEKLQQMELETEKAVTIPREGTPEILDYVKKMGKKLILVTDMYLPLAFIRQILSLCGIEDGSFERIYLSCEEKASKYDGTVWKRIKRELGTEGILHIGDNEAVDICMAQRAGIDVWHLPGAANRIDYGRLFELNSHNNCWQNRLLLGNFIARSGGKIFLTQDGKIPITTMYEVGRLFFGPVVFYFMEYLVRSVKKEKIHTILFAARDGYLLEKIYQKYYEKQTGVRGAYFLTSRTALTGAGISDEEDIREVCRLFGTQSRHTYEDFLKIIFRVSPHEDDCFRRQNISEMEMERLEEHLVKEYKEEILNISAREYEGYMHYLEGILPERLLGHCKVGFVNFIGSGGTQHFFEKLFPDVSSVFYYFSMIPKNMAIDFKRPYFSAFPCGSVYTSQKNNLVQYMIAGECVFTAPYSQLLYFDSQGVPVFVSPGKHENFEPIDECHRGILDFMQIMKKEEISLDGEYVDPALVDTLYGLLYSGEVFEIKDEVKKCFEMVDIVTTSQKCTGW